jgi:hypothetical protein
MESSFSLSLHKANVLFRLQQRTRTSDWMQIGVKIRVTTGKIETYF